MIHVISSQFAFQIQAHHHCPLVIYKHLISIVLELATDLQGFAVLFVAVHLYQHQISPNIYAIVPWLPMALGQSFLGEEE